MQPQSSTSSAAALARATLQPRPLSQLATSPVHPQVRDGKGVPRWSGGTELDRPLQRSPELPEPKDPQVADASSREQDGEALQVAPWGKLGGVLYLIFTDCVLSWERVAGKEKRRGGAGAKHGRRALSS